MNLIHFQGQNCYYDCIISIAGHFDLDYPAAFAGLWSETDFRYDPYRKAYLSKRMIISLEALGAKIENTDCFSKEDVIGRLSHFHENELFVVGMDAYFIPWNQFYNTFHGSHYFIARYTKNGDFLCFDPTYNKQDEYIGRDAVIANTFDIIRVSKATGKPLQIEGAREAAEILRTHPATRLLLLSRVNGCVNEERESIILLAKYIDAMISNRILYRIFLEKHMPSYIGKHPLLTVEHLLEWKAVKNGLYKTAVSKDKTGVIKEVCGRLNHIIDEETAMAEKLSG